MYQAVCLPACVRVRPPVSPPTVLMSGWFKKRIPLQLFLYENTFNAHNRPVCTHRQQVEQVCVGVHVGWCDLDQRQLLEDGVQLLGLGQVDPRLLFVGPVLQRHVHGYQVLQVHAEDGEAEAGALREPLAVLAVVAA